MAKNTVRSKDGTVIFVRNVPDDTHKICSIFPKVVNLETIEVPACSKKTSPERLGYVGEKMYSFVEIPPKASRKFVGGGNNDTWEVRQDVSSYDNARDMIGYVFSDTTDEPYRGQKAIELEGRGLFVPKGDVPTAEEIAEAEEKQREFFAHVVQKAQAHWMENRNMREITELSLIAARAVGGKYEWMSGDLQLAPKSDIEKLAEVLSAKLVTNQAAAPAVATSKR